MIYIFWSCRDKIEAKRIVQELLEQRLIACASLFPEVKSLYRWEGKIEESLEVKVILKTLSEHFKAVETLIREKCSYQVPEIVMLSVEEGSPDYLKWVEREVRS